MAGEPEDEVRPTPDTSSDNPDQASPEAAIADARGEEPGELQDKWMRAVADLDNARKRHARELAQRVETERIQVNRAWLPVVDNLELALQHAADQGDPVVIGVRAVRDQAVALLRSQGYARDDEVGVPFDPIRHEVVGVVDDPDVPPGTVVNVLRPGYGEPPDRQLRAAAVLVSRKQE